MNLKALYNISYGMYIVSSVKDGKYNGQIANTVFQITSEPPTIAVSINKKNLTHEFIENSRVFTVTILAENTTMNLIGTFGFKSGRDINKFEGINFSEGKTKSPIVLESAVAYLEAEVINSVDAGTHTIFIGRIVDAEILSNESPMTYSYYHKIKKGKSPKTAPTYIKEENKEVNTDNNNNNNNKNKNFKKEKVMDKYRCKICGYIYDPEEGDPDNGVQPGTSFEDIPDDWVCPICGATKEDFEKVE